MLGMYAMSSEANRLGFEVDTIFEHSNYDAVSRMYSARRGSKLYTLHTDIPTLIESFNRSVLRKGDSMFCVGY